MRLMLSLAMMAALLTADQRTFAQSRRPDKFVSVYRRNVLCSFDTDPRPVATVMHTGHINNDKSERKIYLWRMRDVRKVTYQGTGGTNNRGFWFGYLNGKEAAGYTLSRGHWVFGTADTTLEFECWMKGYEHGSY